jgi:peptidoglycan/LPS O-acetylase OafA/YrhL
MNREIRSLTGIRGVAALWVVTCHWSGDELSGIAKDIAQHGYAAVDLFMILSGFVLAMAYVPRETGYRYFVWQRSCRLYPLYAVTTLVCLAEDWWLGFGVFAPDGGPAVPAVLSNLLMTTTHLWDVDAIDGPSWSISVEFTLNLFFPMFVLLCARLSWRWSVFVAALCGVALVLVSVLNHRLNSGVAGELGTLDTRLMYLRCGPEFALGMLCWRLWQQAACSAVFNPGNQVKVAPRGIPPVSSQSVARNSLVATPQIVSGWSQRCRDIEEKSLPPAALSFTRLFGGTAWLGAVVLAMLAMTPFKAMDLPFVVGCCLLVIGLASERSWIAAALGTPVLHWLGTISFSLYLWHAAFIPLRPILVHALPLTDPAAATMVANTINLGIVLAVSTLSYHRFEIPVRRWLRGRVATFA